MMGDLGIFTLFLSEYNNLPIFELCVNSIEM